MDKLEFTEGMSYLNALFSKPPPKEAIIQAWYEQFPDNATLEQFKNASSNLATQLDRFPPLSAVIAAMSGGSHTIREYESCQHCASGTIIFSRGSDANGNSYEKVSACDCKEGDRRVAVRYKGRSMARYASMYPIETASAGFGVMAGI